MAKRVFLKEKIAASLGWIVLFLIGLAAAVNTIAWGLFVFGAMDYDVASAITQATLLPIMKVSRLLSMLK